MHDVFILYTVYSKALLNTNFTAYWLGAYQNS